MELSGTKPFEQPDAGLFLGTVIDLVEMPNVQTAFGLKNRIRFVWVLGRVDNTPALNSEGKPFIIIDSFNASFNPKSGLYERVKQVLNGAPPLIRSTEELETLTLGRSGQLFLTKTSDPANPAKIYTNIKAVVPLAPGQVPPVAPADYVRVKFRAKQIAGPQGIPVATYATPQGSGVPAPAPTAAVRPVAAGIYTPPAAPPAQVPSNYKEF